MHGCMASPASENQAMPNASEYLPQIPGVYTTSRDFLAVGDRVIQYTELISVVILSGLIGLFGVIANVINIIVFIHLGFQETINISLFAMAISDLASSVLLIWVTICVNPLMRHTDIDFSFREFEFPFGSWPRTMFLVITGFLTVFITVERYLCIVFPLKVKEIMTKKRVTSVIVAIYVIVIASKVQYYFFLRLDWKWIPMKNVSMFGVVYIEYRPVELASQQLDTMYTLSSFIIVSICTALFAWKLNQRRKWRQSVSGAKDTTSHVRDQQIIKMVTCVAVIFILSYCPIIVVLAFLISSPEIDFNRRYENLYVLLISLMTPAGGINSSVNIFIYYRMMSKYRAFLTSLCGKGVKY